MGYVLVAFSLHSFAGYQSALLYVYIYILVNIVLFAILASNVNLKGKTFQNLSELSQLNVNPVQAVIFSISLFSLAGVPPLAGFYGKFYLLYPLISNGFFYISIFLIVLSIVSAGYYMRLVKLVFFDTLDSFAFLRTSNRVTIYMIIIGFIINIGFLLVAKQFLFITELALKSIII
jgi:NADH-quinone oxidoreductase subunit N